LDRESGGVLAAVSMCLATVATSNAQQGQGRGGDAPGLGGGRGQGQGGGRGAVRPECVNPKIPAAECNIGAPPIQWADPPLGDGPFLIESALPQHRNLRVVVMARLQQPWSIAFLPDGGVLVTERGGALRIIRNGVLDPTPVWRCADGARSRLAGLMDVVLHPFC
jgi:glucose/arabinose dehydrogenase